MRACVYCISPRAWHPVSYPCVLGTGSEPVCREGPVELGSPVCRVVNDDPEVWILFPPPPNAVMLMMQLGDSCIFSTN